MSASQFKSACNKVSTRLLGFKCFTKDDDYDLLCLADDALTSGQTPTAFVHEVFADDLAKRENEKHERHESCQSGADIDDEFYAAIIVYGK